ncbi:MAG: hypothetical protein HYY52_08815 [Candidatus Melainabacteria bacterium]|nr:hypothetical protein [Candidatus Melainabacteria bacterium]
MFKDLTKVILTAKAAIDVMKEKIESKASDLVIQVKNFKEKKQDDVGVCCSKPLHYSEFISEITHRAQINEVQLKGLIKDKLIELTNNALLDSMELNDIRAEIAGLRAEIADLKEQIKLSKR